MTNREVEKRIELERSIIRTLCEDLLAGGCKVSVNDGEEITVEDATEIAPIMDAIMTTDVDFLEVTKPDGKRASVMLVYGNGCDVISDYNVSLEPFMARANSVADAAQENMS